MRPLVFKVMVNAMAGLWLLSTGPGTMAQVLSDGNRPALLRGVYEVLLISESAPVHAFQPGLVQVTFTPPGGTGITVDAFYDGGSLFRARAYCREMGDWTWRCSSADATLDGKQGTFRVIDSDLPGKLRQHPADPHQFAYENGEWYLHIGETGYRCLTSTEKKWKPYIDQAVRMGATKIRTWFCQGRHDVQVLFSDGRKSLNLEYWQEMDRRLAYALENHPRLQFQLIPYGEDTEELKRYAMGDEMSKLIAQYAQARFSAYPNVQWCVSNDRHIITDGEETGRRLFASTIDQIALDMKNREPWGTLLTNHQSRFSGYHFADAKWSNITTLEDLDQVTGELILQYREKSQNPVVLDEDRYETYREPEHPRYFFRRLMWASLFSGGFATYGGYRTYEAHRTGDIPKDTVDIRGIQGYYDGSAELSGADDFVHIHHFFRDARLTLVGLRPDDGFTGNDPSLYKCIRDEKVCMIYLANPGHSDPGSANVSDKTPEVELSIPSSGAKWFNPSSGKWTSEISLDAGIQMLQAPFSGDWILLLLHR